MASLQEHSRLTLRIYLVGLAQIAVIFAGFVYVDALSRQRPPHELYDEERSIERAVEDGMADLERFERQLLAIRDDSGLQVKLFDTRGALLLTTVPDDAPDCIHHRRDPHRDGHPPRPPPPRRGMDEQPRCYSTLVTLPSGASVRVEFRRSRSAPPSPFSPIIIALVLVVVAISSIALARSLVIPLRRLAAAARAFGEGDLSARVGLERRDELGAVARTFDEMAERVTDLVRSEKELMANVSHELRTPLARIRVALDIAAEGDASLAQQMLPDITDDLEELERLIEDVLTATRLDLATDAPRGIPPLRKEPVSLGDLLAQAIARFESAHPEGVLDCGPLEDLPSVEGDAVMLRRVLDNLLDNAHKYTDPPEDRIELTARRDEAEVVIEVRDRGMGIAASDIGLVFRPFFRVDRSRTRATGGLGLGLALAKRIVEAHGGTITLESEVGEGTLASVRLPVLQRRNGKS